MRSHRRDREKFCSQVKTKGDKCTNEATVRLYRNNDPRFRIYCEGCAKMLRDRNGARDKLRFVEENEQFHL